jgi:hypothetical protein
MDSILTAFPELIPYGILLGLAVIFVLGMRLFREREHTGDLPQDRWRRWARRTVGIQVIFALLYPAFISDGFSIEGVPVSLVPIAWGFYTLFCYRTSGEHWVGFVAGALSVFWIYIAWDSNIKLAFVR